MVISPLTNESQVSLLNEIPASRLIADWNNIKRYDFSVYEQCFLYEFRGIRSCTL